MQTLKKMKVKSIYLYMIFVVLLALTVMLSHDDFFWGSSSGAIQFKKNFDGYNGRYIGNMVILLMTRSIFFRVVVYSIVSISIPILISKITPKKINMSFIIFLLMTIPMSIFSQTFGWFSGFANYNISTALLLLIFYLIFKKNFTWFLGLFLFLLAMITQLFLENVTIINMLISFVALVLLVVFKKEQFKLTFFWFIGSLFGFFVMFNNSAYTSNTSRSLSNVHFTDVYAHLLQDWSELLIKDNILLLLLFSLAIYFIMKKSPRISLFLLFFNIYFILRDYLGVSFYNQNFYILNFELFLIIIFVIIMFITGIIFLEKEDRVIYFIALTAAVLYTSPFLITTPFGPRNILSSYILLIICLSVLFSNLPELKFMKLIDKYMMYILVSIGLIMISMYATNKITHNKRIIIISQESLAEDNVIEVEKSPYPFLGQRVDGFENPMRLIEMKEYYGIHNNVEVKVVNREKPIQWVQENN